jgi:vanillate O-demethylase monooxygenase subunit
MSFIKNDWYVAAWADEVAEQPLARVIGNEPVVMFRDTSGRAAALQDRCCHRGAPLSMGAVTPKGLQCNYHGLTFDASGKCVHIPGQDHIPAKACVRSYPLVEKDGMLWIWPGDPALADASRIVDYPYHNDPKNWPQKHGMIPIAGHYMLLIDNLMDLTHIGYVHKKTIGSGPAQEYVHAIMNTDRTERGVKFVRWFLEHEPPATYVKAVGFKGKVDRWQEFEFVAPGSVLQFTGAVDAGTGAYDQGKRDGGFALRIFHTITPATDNSCYYFFSTMNGYRQDDPAATEQLYDEIVRTFHEDRIFVEGQQARTEKTPEPQMDIVSDTARVYARRHVNERLAQEAQGNNVVPIAAAAAAAAQR